MAKRQPMYHQVEVDRPDGGLSRRTTIRKLCRFVHRY